MSPDTHTLIFVTAALALLPFQDVAALSICLTGTNSGIGRAAAARLVSEGHTIYHACRTYEGARSAASACGGGVPMSCDLASFESVRNFAADLGERCGGEGLDVLGLNAGVSPSRRALAPKLTTEGLEETVGVNHLGHFLLADLIRPLLEKNRSGVRRVVVTASSVHDPASPGGTVQGDEATGATLGDLSGLGANIGAGGSSTPLMVDGAIEFNGAKAYHDSKLCNVLFAREAHRRWRESGISVRAFNPGLITSTGLFRNAREDNPVSTAIFGFVASRIAGFSVPVEVGGGRLAYVATAGEEEIEPGAYLSAAEATSRAVTRAEGFGMAKISEEAGDDALAAMLWERSAEVISRSWAR